MKKIVFLLAGAFIISSAAMAKTKTTAADSTKYAEYYGKYKFDPGSQVEEADIKWQDTTLIISTAMGDATLTYQGVDSFLMSYMDGILTFKRGDDKKVKGLHISVSGADLDAAKQAPAAGTALRKEDLVGEKKEVAVK